MGFCNDFINDSPTICGIVGETIENGSHKAVMYDKEGHICIATSGASAFGVALSTTSENLEIWDDIHVLIRDIGLLEVSESVKTGDFLTIDSKGCGIVATSGATIFGRAFTKGDKGTLVKAIPHNCHFKISIKIVSQKVKF